MQLSLLDWTPPAVAPTVPRLARVYDGSGWYIVSIMSAEIIDGPIVCPDEAIARIDELDPDADRFKLVRRCDPFTI